MISQSEMLMAYLAQGHEISQLEAITNLGIGRLAARIFDIKRKGFPVITEMREVKKANGEKAHVAYYKMKTPEVQNV